MFWGTRSASAALSAVLFFSLTTPAQASFLALQPTLGSGLKTTVASQFALDFVTGANSFASVTERVGVKIQVPSGLLDANHGAQLVAPNGLRYKVPTGDTSEPSGFQLREKTVLAGGLLQSDLTLSQAGSPYKIEAPIEVPSGITLTVEAGVVLDIRSSYPNNASIWANGDVYFNGTVSNPIKVSTSRYSSFLKLENASGNTVQIQGTQIFGAGGSVVETDWQSATLSIEDSELYGFSGIGYFYSPTDLTLARNVFSSAGLITLGSGSTATIVDNLFLGGTRTSIRVNTSQATIVGNNFDGLVDSPIKFYASANVQGNFWGTTVPGEIAAMVLDSNDSLEYGSGVQADYSLPLAEPSPNSPANASFAELASYFNPDFMYESLPRVFLTPSDGATASFQVRVTAFLDTVVSDGQITSGEVVSQTSVVQFVGFDPAELGTSLTASATYLGSSITGSVSLGEGFNLNQLDTSSFKIQRLSTSTIYWSDIASASRSFYDEALRFSASVDAIQEDVYLRLMVAGSYTQQLTIAINDNENTTIQLSGPRTVTPGSTLRIDVSVRDSSQNPVVVGYSDIAKLTFTYNGPGLLYSNSPLYTNDAGEVPINVLLGANDSGVAEFTVTLDPDGDLGTRNVVSQTISVFVGTIGDLVSDSDSGEVYVLSRGIKYKVPSSYPNVLSSLGNATTVTQTFLADYATGHSFSGVLKDRITGEYFVTDDSSLEELDDCFLSAQFSLSCSLAIEVSSDVLDRLKSELGVTTVPVKTFDGLGTLLSPVVEIQGVPGLGKNLSARLTGVQADSFSSLRWIRVGSPETILLRDRVTYQVQAADVGRQVLFEITVSKPNYSPRTVRSEAVSTLATATPIPWTPSPGPVIVVPPVDNPPAPQGQVNSLDEFSAWTKKLNTWNAKVYVKNLVGVGKVQVFLNGREIAWVRAVSNADPDLRVANGAPYLVRTVFLQSGKNILEVYLDGQRVTRTAYSR